MKKHFFSILKLLTILLLYPNINCIKDQNSKRNNKNKNNSNNSYISEVSNKKIKIADSVRPSDISRELF